MKISARNQIPGQVVKISTGAVNSEIVIKLPGGGELVSVITKTAAKSLQLKKGKAVIAVIKSSDILIGVP